MRFRPLVLTTIALAVAAFADPASGQRRSEDTGRSADEGRWSSRASRIADDASMPVAILIRNPDRAGGAPPYALADQYGQAQRFVEASPRIDLDRYLGRRVRVRHDTGMTLLPSQLELPPIASSDRAPRRLAEIDATPLERLATVEPAAYTDGRTPRVASLDRLRSTTRRRGSYRTAQAGDLPGPGGDPIDLGRARYEVLPGSDLPPVDLPAAEITDSPTAGDASSEPIDLDELLAEEGDTLPPPETSTTLEPIPAGEPYYDGVVPSHGDDCPHCREKSITQKHAPTTAACPECNQPCERCGEQWGGPRCNPASRRGPYGRIEYLLWHADGFDTPPLVTTNDQGGAPAIGQAGTRTVYGGELLDDTRNGLRLSGGYWFDDQRDLALEFDWLWLETASDLYAFSDPTGASILGRPFYNVAPVVGNVVQPPVNDAQLVSFPNTVGGDLEIYARTEFNSLGIRARTGLCCREIGGGCDQCGCNGCRDGRLGGLLGGGRRGRPDGISRVDATVGYRYARLQDHLGFRESLTDLTGGGGAVGVNEAFDTSNEFHGVDFGVVYDWQTTRWGLELVGRIAVGSTEQQVGIRGENRVGVPGGAGVTSTGGLLAQTSNIGVYERDRFSVLPELSARLSYRVTPQLSVSAAYTLLYWANVVRPGDQIDYSVDGRLASGALVSADPFSHPRFDLEETSFWAHGLSFGADYRY